MVNKKGLAIVLIVIFVISAYGVFTYFNHGEDLGQRTSLSDESSTSHGESLNIKLNVGGKTLSATVVNTSHCSALAVTSEPVCLGERCVGSNASSFGTVQRGLVAGGNASESFYTVNSTYYSQQKVSYSVTLTVTGSNVGSVIIKELKLKCVDVATAHVYYWLSITDQGISLPYSHEFAGWSYIADQLDDLTASLSDATVQYLIYAKVQATGSISGTVLTSETGGGSYVQFECFHFVLSSETAGSEVTPAVSASSWLDVLGENLGILGVLVIAGVCVVVVAKKVRGNGRKVVCLCLIGLVVGSILAVSYPTHTPLVSVGSGEASHGDERISFRISTGSQFDYNRQSGAKWYVGGVQKTNTHYAYSLTLSGTSIIAGSVSYCVQFKATLGGSSSVRWIENVTGKSLTTYANSFDEAISDLGADFGISQVNNTVSTLTYSVYVDMWAVGSTSGQVLHAHTASWLPFASNSIMYQFVGDYTFTGTYYYVQERVNVQGQKTSGGTAPAGMQVNDTVYCAWGGYRHGWKDMHYESETYVGYMMFTGLPSPSSTVCAISIAEAVKGIGSASTSERHFRVYNFVTSSWSSEYVISTPLATSYTYETTGFFPYTSANLNSTGALKIEVNWTCHAYPYVTTAVNYLAIKVYTMSDLGSWVILGYSVSEFDVIITVIVIVALVCICSYLRYRTKVKASRRKVKTWRTSPRY